MAAGVIKLHEDAVVGGVERHCTVRIDEDAKGWSGVGVDDRLDRRRGRLQALPTLRVGLADGDGQRQGHVAGIDGGRNQRVHTEIDRGHRKHTRARRNYSPGWRRGRDG
jgi:hypothetical protein